MAVALEQKNLLTYLEAFQERVRRRTNINLFDKDSKTQALIDIFSDQLLADRRDSISAFNSLQISQASGDQLDRLGLSRGLPRLGETFATVSRNELSLAFYVAAGTFGDINAGSTITVPKGTKISSTALQNDLGKVITYVLTEDCICLNTETIAYASARAEASGSDFNVGASVLKSHDFSSYVDKTGLLVLNFYSILNGRKRETDDQYRFRLSQFYTTVATTNETKTKLIALTVPGVLDSRVLAGHFGIGTVGLVVLGTEFQSSTALVSAVQAAVDAVALPGVKVTAVPAVNALVDIEVTLTTTRTLSTADQSRVKNTLRRLSVNYLRSKGLGGTLSLTELAQLWAKYTNGLVQFSTAAVDIFDHVFIRRGYVTASASERETMSSAYYTLEPDEFADLGTLTITFE
jgi:uncharacterized phage protein gp47/JayE